MASTVLDRPQSSLRPGGSPGSLADTARHSVAGERVDAHREPPGHDQPIYTFLMTDMVGSTHLAGALGDRAWGDRLSLHNATVRQQLRLHGGHEVATTGDGFFAVFGSPVAAVLCALAALAALEDDGIQARAGLHRGSCVLVEGIPAGVAVHIAARVTARASAGQVLVSQPLVDLLAGPEVAFKERSLHYLKGIPVPYWLYAAAVRSPDPRRRRPDMVRSTRGAIAGAACR
jgi:class 3 adenylate cyclase